MLNRTCHRAASRLASISFLIAGILVRSYICIMGPVWKWFQKHSKPCAACAACGCVCDWDMTRTIRNLISQVAFQYRPCFTTISMPPFNQDGQKSGTMRHILPACGCLQICFRILSFRTDFCNTGTAHLHASLDFAVAEHIKRSSSRSYRST